MIRAQGLHVTFGPGTPMETRALQGVDLEIPAGQYVSLIGSNGAGKSTLLNCLTGEVGLDQGSIVIDESEVTAWPAPRRAALVARVFQDPLAGTCEGLTIEENMALAAARGTRRGLSPALHRARREEFRERIAVLGLNLENRLADRMGLLSGGQRQAVSLVMATLRPTKILLLDEHTAALDPRMSAFVLKLTRELIEAESLTTLMVTHSMGQALEFGTRTVMLHEGRVVLETTGQRQPALGLAPHGPL
jgi:putative ABC transport system ATP-binding protein